MSVEDASAEDMPVSDSPAHDAFDLEAAIRAWRSQTAAHGTATAVLDELEDHLRESFATLARGGMGGDAAWGAAVARLGDSRAIGREFGKLDRLPAIDRLALGSLVGLAALAGAALLAAIASRGVEVVQRPVLTMHVVAITSGYSAGLFAAAVAAYATLRSLASRSAVPGLRGATLRLVRIASVGAAALVVVGFLLGAVWANDAWGRPFNADPREIGALLVAASFLIAAAAAFTRAADWAPTMALAGGGVVLAAWFGVAAHLQSYPAWSSGIGFGGLAIAVVLAALSLRARTRLEARA